MDYLRSFLEEKKRVAKPLHPTDRTDKTPSVSFVSEPPARSSVSLFPRSPGQERQRWPEQARPLMPLRRCGALVCRTCHVLSPCLHRKDCALPRFEPCGSRWFWLSPHGAIKCVACASPADLSLVEAWVMARETGEGNDGWRIPEEILSLLHIVPPLQ